MNGFQHIADSIIGNYKEHQIPIIYGQTATGKTRLSLELAKGFKENYGKDVEIISADSRQVYKYMDIGTDKIGLEVRSQIIHHLIDIIEPDQTYTAGQRQQDAYDIIEGVISRGNVPVIVGGTGLYIDTILYNFNMGICEPNQQFRDQLEEKVIHSGGDSDVLWNMLHEVDPVEAARHHPSSTRFIIRALEIYHETGITKTELMKKQEPRYSLLMVGLWQDVELGNKLIDERLELMIKNGLIAEVQGLLDKGYSSELSSMKTIDYKQTVSYIQNRILYSDYISSLQIANHQLAKKQRTWFRRYLRSEESEVANSELNSEKVSYLHFYLPDYIL